jgi:hypothetical protein
MTEQTHGTGIESIVPDGKVRWIRFRRVDGASRSEWLGYWMFVRRYKEAA